MIAHEYPGWLSQTLAYGTAGAVSLARVTGRKHFPSDAAVGAGLGWLIGSQIYHSHHETDLDDSEYGNFIPIANDSMAADWRNVRSYRQLGLSSV